MKNIMKPEVSRGLARLFNEKKIFSLTERDRLMNKYDSLEQLKKALE